jgi:transcriptional regulator with XRE-family HTH domain
MNGNELKGWRQSQEWSQAKAARYLGTTQAFISMLESGERDIPRTMDILLHLLGKKRNVTDVENFLFSTLDTKT